MRILVIGSGGREHALAWRLALEGHEVHGYPGNPGIADVAHVVAAPDNAAAAALVKPDLTVVGPETPLVEGIVDDFAGRGLPIVGPTREMAQLEASKIYSKQFMDRLAIQTARFVQAESEQAALDALVRFTFPVVVKADGLAAGKGVIIAQTRSEAESAIRALGPKLILEEFLEGEEVSFIALCDGRNILPLEATQDHKKVGDGDTGPNTGGMGAYCDGRILSPAETGRIMDVIIEPAVQATGFKGFLYAGLMMTAAGPKVLEFNVRLGDPETQPLMQRVDRDWGETLLRAATGNLKGATLRWKTDPSVCVVLAAHGYPGQVRTGDVISGIESSGAQVFQAGTKRTARGLETSGGRVLGVTSSGPDLDSAIQNAYAAAGHIRFDGMHYRRDIGQKGRQRWSEKSQAKLGAKAD